MSYNIALIGYGAIAQTMHRPLILHCPDLHLTAIASSKPREQLPEDITHYPNPEALLADPDIDIVAITAPNAVHYSLAKAALNAGKHVVLEKPMTNTAFEAQDLITTARLNNRLLTVFHNHRLDSDYLTLKHLVAENRVGAVRRLISNWNRFRPIVRQRWREQAGAGSGVWYDLGAHLIDQATDLFGLPEALTGRCLALRPNSPAVDYAQVTLHYPDKEVQLGISSYTAAPNLRYQLEGELGSYVQYGLDPQEAQLKANLPLDDSRFGLDTDNPGIFYDADGNAHTITPIAGRFVDFYPNLVAALNGEATLLITPEVAMQTITLLELAQQSSDLGRTLPVLSLELN